MQHELLGRDPFPRGDIVQRRRACRLIRRCRRVGSDAVGRYRDLPEFNGKVISVLRLGFSGAELVDGSWFEEARYGTSSSGISVTIRLGYTTCTFGAIR